MSALMTHDVPQAGETTPVKPGANAIIGSFDKGLNIFEFLIDSDEPIRIVDVAREFDIDKSSALRFLNTLERHGLAQKNPLDKTYTVGARIEYWAKSLRQPKALVEIARPYLRKLSEMTGQTSHLAIVEDDRAILIEVMPSDSVVSVRQTAGDWEPLYCTAVGKAILAHMSPAEQERLIAQMHFRRLTEKTITSAKQLRRELDRVLEERVAFDDAENNPQVSCIAAPLLDRQGFPLASVGISMVTSLHEGGPRRQVSMIAAVRRIADEITASLL
ncbi:MAG: IclR family transcriptional regulator [Dechloromonas sp.]|nr:IclR family transcriptional regulator [Dechloromonas sp.]